ncbi:MAG: response regulator [Desulfobacteraceae bacterium]|nr:response regulator [Desulfobacteraceae bacterium]
MNNEKEAFILIVDDNPKNLQVLGNILREKQHKTAAARDGFQALKYVEKRPPDLILLDIMMPEMDGYEVCRKLKSQEQTKNIPVIFISALSDTSEKVKGFEAGGVDYITKPFQKEEVFARVNVHLELRRSHMELEKTGDELRQAKSHLETVLAQSEKERKAAETANRKITDSIYYAKMIQKSLLPNSDNIKNLLSESFSIMMPRDIVGGDFIYADYYENSETLSFIVGVIDCTGHGVPGAFMTIIAFFGLKKIIKDEGITDPAQILSRLNFIVKTSLHQDTEYASSDDGLDAAVCLVSPENKTLTFSGARLPLLCVRDNSATVIKGDKHSIGYKRSDTNFNFTSHSVNIEEGTCFYMFSDGFADQLDAKSERRLGTRKFVELIRENAHLPFDEQRNKLIQAFNEHKGDNEKQDDVTVVGFGFLEI